MLDGRWDMDDGADDAARREVGRAVFTAFCIAAVLIALGSLFISAFYR